ncbi:monooxygenase [Lampropedia puyangensis]|uniref:Monooxygenase n=1 Tax=Lampropedia puyangensis TaxID=1330072 RepID=A0A4S8F7D4_9BURK|nr:acyl-CoA dehydrogenase family protein [Lampropedia puyangensis]THU02565.1 monooxygenase [Lampropedia puyangensis]
MSEPLLSPSPVRTSHAGSLHAVERREIGPVRTDDSVLAEHTATSYTIPKGTWQEVAQGLAQQFAATAAVRDLQGGTPLAERQALRESGLLRLSIPQQWGGLGADWVQTLDAVRTIATADSSLAHVLGFQHLHLATVQLFGEPAQWQPWLEQTARLNWFWGNTLNPLDRRTIATRQEGYWEFSGKKSFTSGALDSQMLVASAIDALSGQLLIGVVPSERSGISLLHDWNNMGQRQTDSGSALFERVRVEQAELLLKPGPLSTVRSTLRPLLAQLIFVHLFLGIAQGAFEQAKTYTQQQAQPWFKSDAETASKDVHVLALFGEFWSALEATRLLALQAAELFEAAWQAEDAITVEQRGRVAVAVTAAKVAASRSGLDLTSRLFEATGARATHAALRFDRFWRNLRTQTLHDPLHYKLQELGDWALNGDFPAPSFYS